MAESRKLLHPGSHYIQGVTVAMELLPSGSCYTQGVNTTREPSPRESLRLGSHYNHKDATTKEGVTKTREFLHPGNCYTQEVAAPGKFEESFPLLVCPSATLQKFISVVASYISLLQRLQNNKGTKKIRAAN